MYSDIEISGLPRAELLLAIKILKFKVFNFLGGQLWSALVTFIKPECWSLMREDRSGSQDEDVM